MKAKYIKIAVPSIVVLYILFGLVPFMGRAYVSAETRSAFSMENFHGQYMSPERVMLLEDPQDAFFHRVNLISNAQEQILLASFAIRGGTSSDIVIGALLCAADRGVSVSIINNAVGGQMPSRYLNVLAAHENIEVYLFNRLELLRPWYINSALHDKYMVVDHTFMILGGRNIGDRDFAPDDFTGRVSLDREVLVYNTDRGFHGSITAAIDYFYSKINSPRTSLSDGVRRSGGWDAEHFIELFTEYKEGLAADDFDYYSNTVQVNRITLITNSVDTAKNESIVAYNLMMIAQNSDVIIAQSPYVALTRRNFRTFAETVSDRDFTLLTNSLASTPNLPSFSSYYVSRRNIARTGITLYEYQDTQTSIHAKTYLFDGRLVAIGSFNLNERSIRSDTESMLIIDSEEFHDIVFEAINCQISQSLRVTADNNYEPCDYVEAAHVSLGKRALYTTSGILLRILRFMF